MGRLPLLPDCRAWRYSVPGDPVQRCNDRVVEMSIRGRRPPRIRRPPQGSSPTVLTIPLL
jgi:hypothetical protein